MQNNVELWVSDCLDIPLVLVMDPERQDEFHSNCNAAEIHEKER